MLICLFKCMRRIFFGIEFEWVSISFWKLKLIITWFMIGEGLDEEKKNKRPAYSEMNHFSPFGMTERLLINHLLSGRSAVNVFELFPFCQFINIFICNHVKHTTDTIIPGKCTVEIGFYQNTEHRISRSAVQRTKHKRNAHTLNIFDCHKPSH